MICLPNWISNLINVPSEEMNLNSWYKYVKPMQGIPEKFVFQDLPQHISG